MSSNSRVEKQDVQARPTKRQRPSVLLNYNEDNSVPPPLQEEPSSTPIHSPHPESHTNNQSATPIVSSITAAATSRQSHPAAMSSSAHAPIVPVQRRLVGRVYLSPGEIFNNIKEALDTRSLHQAPVYDAATSGKRWLDSRVTQIVQQVIRHDNFRLYGDDNPVAPATSSAVLENIVKRYFILDNDVARASLLMHRSGMYRTANGFLVEFTSNVRKRGPGAAKRGAFTMRKLESTLPSWLPWESVFKDAVTRMSGNLLQANAYYPFIYNPDCRGLFQAIFIHSTGILGCFLMTFHKKKAYSTQDHPAVIIKNMEPSKTSNGYVSTYICDTTMDCMNDFRENIWGIVMDDIARLAHNVYAKWILMVVPSDRVRYGRVPASKKTTFEKFYIRSHDINQVLNPRQLLHIVFQEDRSVDDFWASLASHLFRTFLPQGMGLHVDVVDEERFDHYYAPALTHFYELVHQLILSTVHNAPHSFNNQVQEVIAEESEGRDAWVQRIISVVKKNPIRYINAKDLGEIVSSERSTLETDIPSLPDRNTSDAQGAVENINSPDVEAEAQSYNDQIKDAEKKIANRPGRVQLYAVSEPPDDCLDCNSKCTSCGIDWSKLKGVVEIFKVGSEVNADDMNNVFQKLMDARNKGTIRASSTEDYRKTPRRVGETSVPPSTSTAIEQQAQPNSSDNINLSILDDIIQEPASQNHESILKSQPPIALSVIKRLFADEETPQTSLPSIVPTNVPAPKNTNEQRERTTNKDQLDNSNDDDEIIQEPSRTPSAQQRQPQPEHHDPQPAVSDEDVEEDNSVSVVECQQKLSEQYGDTTTMEMRVQGLDTTEDFHTLKLLLHWYSGGFIHVDSIISLDDWLNQQLVVTSGPLLGDWDEYRQPLFANMTELIGTYGILCSYELYVQLYSFIIGFRAMDTWKSIGTDVATIPSAPPENRNGFLYFNRDIRRSELPNFHAVKNALVTYHQFSSTTTRIQRTSGDYNQVVLHSVGSFLCLVTSITPRLMSFADQDDEWVDTVQFLVLVQAPERKEEEREFNFVRDDVPNPVWRAHVRDIGFIGSTQDYMTISKHGSINSLPRSWLQILQRQVKPSNQHLRLDPFSNKTDLAAADIAQYLNQTCRNDHRLRFFRLLYGLQATTLPRSGDPLDQYCTAKDLPSFPMSAQLQATVTACEMLDNNMDPSRYDANSGIPDSQILSIIGPAGTGKTKVLLDIVSAALNVEGVAEEVVKFYDHIEYAKQVERGAGFLGEPTSRLTSLPEDTLRILVITETNSALEAFENKLFNDAKGGIYINPYGTHLRRLVPSYQKLARKRSDRGIEDESILQRYYIPDSFKTANASTGSITLTTFGSVQKAFSNSQFSKLRETQMIPQYDLVIVDEASQVGVRSFLTGLVETSQNDTVQRRPMYIICGDHCQNPPMAHGPPNNFERLARLSILDMVVARNFKYQRAYSFSPSIQLNIQFRMAQPISDLSNAITGREVATHPSVLDECPADITRTTAFYLSDNLEPLRHHQAAIPQDILSFHLLWVDPYISHFPTTSISSRFRKPAPSTTISFKEALTCVNMVDYLLSQTTIASNTIVILTPYNDQKKLIERLLNDRRWSRDFRSRCNGNVTIEQINTSTVGSIQGTESDYIIYSLVRHQQSPGKRGLGIVGNLNTAYVGCTRAKFMLTIVGDYDYISSSDTVWSDACHYIDSNRCFSLIENETDNPE